MQACLLNSWLLIIYSYRPMKRFPVTLFIVAVFVFTSCGVEGVGGKAAERESPAVSQDTERAKVCRVDTLAVALTGDIMMGTAYPDTMLPANDGRGLFRDVAGILARADLAVGNLEGTLCDSAEARKRGSDYTYSFRTPLSFASRLKEAGYDYLSMANNHSFDFGMRGIVSTERALDRLGISYSGVSGRAELAVVRRGGMRYGVCAFGHNAHTLRHQDLPKVRQVLDSLRSSADIVVVSFHGGGEGASFSRLPEGKEMFLGEDRGDLRGFARFCIDNGADIVFGHGPHVVRCVELYKDRFIAYSLGNFCTPYAISIVGLSGFAPVIEVKTDKSGKFLAGRIHSFIQRKGLGPRRDTCNAVVRQIRTLTDADVRGGGLRISDDGLIEPTGKRYK